MFLIVGADSEIGSATARMVRQRGGQVVPTTRRSAKKTEMIPLDLRNSIADLVVPPNIRSACIFVAVARLAACEADPVGSAFINVERTISLVDLLTAQEIYTLFLSTNQVFDGESECVPNDAPSCPISEYGRQKAKTEQALLARMTAGAPIGILRLAKVVSPGMPLLNEWKRELVAGRAIHAFSDMTIAPTPIELVTMAIARMLEDQVPTVAQLTGPRDLSYLEVARFVANKVGAFDGLVQQVSAAQSGMPQGSTPRNTTLDGSYLRDKYGIRAPDALDVVGKLIDDDG